MIGKNVSRLRESLSISQRELARRVGMSGQMISKIENDLSNPSVDTLNRLAEALNCSLFDLTMDTDMLKNDMRVIECSKPLIAIAEKYGFKIQEEYDNDGDGEYLRFVYVSFSDKKFRLTGIEFYELISRINDSIITNILASENYDLLK